VADLDDLEPRHCRQLVRLDWVDEPLLSRPVVCFLASESLLEQICEPVIVSSPAMVWRTPSISRA
jgi:hypothetical protein